MANALHSAQTVADGIHIPTRWEYTNTTARDAASYTSADVGGIARVGSAAPYDFYLLTNSTGPAWSQLGGGGSVDHSALTGVTANQHHNQAHAFGGADHTASTLAQVNAKVSDATLIDTGDSRLSDARTPTSHASTHQSGGGDAVKLDDLATPDDNTDLDASTSAHGLLKKLGGGTTNFLRADGTWSAPPGDGQVLYDAIVAASGGDYTSVAAAFAGGASAVWVQPGFYVETADVVMPDLGVLHSAGAVISFNGGDYSVIADGSGGTKETAGTISLTNGDATVTGSGTTFTNLSAGDYLKVGDTYMPIDSITSDTSLELDKTWKGDTVTGLSYIAQAMHLGVTINGIAITGALNTGLYIRAVIGAMLSSMSIHSNGLGVEIVDSYGVNVDGCSANGNTSNGFVITNCSEVSFSGSSHADGNTSDGIVVDGTSEGIFLSNTSVTNNGGDGITIEDTAHVITLSNIESAYNNGDGLNADPTTATVLCSNCVFSHNGAWGLDWDGPYNVLNGCVLEDNDAGGIQGGDTGTIISCHVADNGGIGINLDGTDDNNTVVGCIVNDNTGIGIYCDADSNVIDSNHVYDNGGIGISLGSGASDCVLSTNIVTGNTGGQIVDAGTDNLVLDDAFHPDLSGQIDALTEKVTPVSADVLVIEDSADSDSKKKVQIGNLPSGTALTSTAPVNVTKATAAVGVGTTAARHDHKHDVTTAAAVAVGTANAEGNSTSLARANHTHQVTGLVIASQAQGDVLYFNGSSWVRLAAGTSGHFLKTNGAGANPAWAAAGGGGTTFKEYLFQADQLETPNASGDWAESDPAPLVADSNNAGISVRRFDDTIEEGVGFTVKVPSGASNIILEFLGRAQTAPGSTQAVKLDVFNRGLPDNAAVESWPGSAYSLTAISIPTNSYFQKDSQTIALSTLSIETDKMYQFELERDTADAGDTLVGDWCLHSVRVRFS